MMRGDQGRPASDWQLLCVCESECVKYQTRGRASSLPAGVVLDPAVCVRVGQFGGGARPANSIQKGARSIIQLCRFQLFDYFSNKRQRCRK